MTDPAPSPFKTVDLDEVQGGLFKFRFNWRKWFRGKPLWEYDHYGWPEPYVPWPKRR